MSNRYTIALPSKGAIAEPTLDFLRECGLRVDKPNVRQYTGSIPALPQLDVLFQRVTDVVYKVADGTAAIGVTGFDVVHENPNDEIIVIHDKLGYGHCSLEVAVPEAWVDVEHITDLTEVAMDFRDQKKRSIRIATTYEHSAREFLHQHGIHHFTIVKAEGAIEAAPTIGYADFIVDLTQTGTTLRENHLKMIRGGTIITSQACLIGNIRLIRQSESLRQIIRTITEYVDASIRGKQYYQLTVDVQGQNPSEIAARIMGNPATRGLLGPTISPIFSNKSEQTWYTTTMIVEQKQMLSAVEYMRSIGGMHAIVTPVRYLFLDQSPTYQKLLHAIGLADNHQNQ
jgi:ATP phosphoribosyltransferase